MARRFYFDLVSDVDAIPDSAGIEAAGIEQAFSEANATLSQMRASGELPDGAEDWQMVIRDEAGAVLRSIRLG